jgi:hypothetical protein
MTRARYGILIAAFLIAAFLIGPRAAAAEEETRATVKVPTGSTFVVRPIKQCFEARAGQVIPFRFTAAAGKDPVVLEVRAVGYSQREDGSIVADEGGAAPADVILDAGARLRLASGASGAIEGRVVVRGEGSRHRVIGLLVSEVQADPSWRREAGDTKKSLHVRFALRYLARIEVTVQDARSASRLSDLQLLQVHFENPTPEGFELEARAQLYRSPSMGRLGPEFPLILPAKAKMAGAGQSLSRLLPGATVRLEALVPEPLLPGEYAVELRLREGREQMRHTFTVQVAAGTFPAQAALLPRVVSTVEVSPPQLELAAGKGGRRMLPLLFENRGDGEVEVRLAGLGQDTDGAPAWLIIQPATLLLSPGAKRRVAVSFRGLADPAPDRYAHLVVEVIPRDGAPGGEKRIPIAFLGTGGTAPHAEIGTLAPLPGKSGIAFSLPVENVGATHLAVQATLTVKDPFGRVLEEIPGGFGEWLLPGEKCDLVFSLQRPLQPGSYRLEGQITLGRDAEPILTERTLQIP